MKLTALQMQRYITSLEMTIVASYCADAAQRYRLLG